MKIVYTNAYHIICNRGKQRNFSILEETYHNHHIIPRHQGGTDDKDNIAYLTRKEHIIAHYLLWKIHRNANDLRSMKMLGANLNREYRKTIGKWCYHNKIGMYGANNQTKKTWILRAIKTQIEKKVGIFDPNKRKEYASIGGKASIKSPNNPWSYWASQEGRLQRASLGGKAHKGKVAMHKPGEQTFKRIHKQEVQKYKDMGYCLGLPFKSRPYMKGKPSKHRRQVTDGIIIYNSIHEAAEKNNVTPGAIIHRCKTKKSTWSYVCENEP